MGKLDFKPGNMLYPLPAVMVSVRDKEGNDNIITVAWTGTVCTNPPMLYISVRPERHSYKALHETGEFVVNLTTEKIAKGEIHSATVYEDSHFTVILDVNPATKGHCLIIPKEHFDNIYDLDGETAGKLFALATCIARAMRDALKCDGLNLVQNNGEIAGQTVNHFHLHLIPRYEGDGLNLNWPQQEISAEQLEEIRQSIKKSI